MSQSLTEYVNQKKAGHTDNEQRTPTLKFMYIWQNLDNLFQQMTHDDINELNMNSWQKRMNVCE